MFIPLDIDRQMDGKLITTNHVTTGLPNGRIPIPSNFTPHTAMILPPHVSQQNQNNPITSSNFTLDGGVYQGQPPTATKTMHDVNSNVKVKLFVKMNAIDFNLLFF